MQAQRVAQRIPSLGIPSRMKGVVDLYDVSDDWIPIYDKSALGGFYMAIGTSGNQFKNAPVAGKMMAALVDYCEAGADHDAEPLQNWQLERSGRSVDVGFYSRRRQINEGKQFLGAGLRALSTARQSSGSAEHGWAGRRRSMDREELEAELSILLTELEGEPEDAHEIYLRLKQLIGNMKAFGLAVPQDLERLEREMDAEFSADQARLIRSGGITDGAGSEMNDNSGRNRRMLSQLPRGVGSPFRVLVGGDLRLGGLRALPRRTIWMLSSWRTARRRPPTWNRVTYYVPGPERALDQLVGLRKARGRTCAAPISASPG